MSNRKVDDEQIKEAIDRNLSNRQAAAFLGIDESTWRYRKKKIIAAGYSPNHDWVKEAPEGYHIKGNSTYYRVEHEPLFNEDGTPQLNEHGQQKFTVVYKPKGQWVKSNKDKDDLFKSYADAAKSICQSEILKLPTVKNPPASNDDLCVNFPLGDPHIGMLAWKQENLDDNWNLEIAENLYKEMFLRAVEIAPKGNTAVLWDLADYFHTDNFVGTTARSGNRLDCDGRFPKMVKIGIKIFITMIYDLLKKYQNVIVKILTGNHDDVGSVFMREFLPWVFGNNPRVTIDTSPAPFVYFQWGKCLIGAHHGHLCKMKDLDGLMPKQKPKEWGETKYRYWYTGHIHKDSSNTLKDGSKAYSFRTLCPADYYATGLGYTPSDRGLQVVVLHKEKGEIERYSIQLPEID